MLLKDKQQDFLHQRRSPFSRNRQVQLEIKILELLVLQILSYIPATTGQLPSLLVRNPLLPAARSPL